MADIQIVHSGQVFYKIDDELASVLCAGLPQYFTRARQKTQPVTAPEPPQVMWAIATNQYKEGAHIQVRMGNNRRVECFGGEPDDAFIAFQKMGFEVPNHIVESYRLALRRAAPPRG